MKTYSPAILPGLSSKTASRSLLAQVLIGVLLGCFVTWCGAQEQRKLLPGETVSGDFRKKSFELAELSDVTFSAGTQFTGADFNLAKLDRASFRIPFALDAEAKGPQQPIKHDRNVDLRGVGFTRASMKGTYLQSVDLESANLSGANLQGATLIDASLKNAMLVDTNLESARVSLADFTGAYFLPKPKSLPYITDFATVIGLDQLRCPGPTNGFESGLVELREALKQAGMRDQERAVNYSIQRERMERMTSLPEWCFHKLLFDLTCRYGMQPGRPLRLLAYSVLLFSLPYWVIILRRRRYVRSGIWAVRIDETVHKRKRNTRPVAVAIRSADGWGRRLRSYAGGWATALYFSLISAFNIGYRDLNVGTWISRMQSREYTLRGTGLVRTLAGIQALLSVYFLALWVLTYFGRPFE